MAAAMRVATFPFRTLFRLIKFLVVPTAFGALSVWLYTVLDQSWLLVLIGLCVLWALVMLRLWKVQVTGELRSLARGTVHVASPRRRPRGGRL